MEDDNRAISAGGEESGVYTDWQSGTLLLKNGNPHAAALVLERVRDAEPSKGSVREALGRAYFNSGRPELAAAEFTRLLEIDPTSDWAHYAVARCALRSGDTALAATHLRLASALRPDVDRYRTDLLRISAS